MCAALLLPNCRDAFLRLSQLPSLCDRRLYSAILLAETQECVSTSFRRTHEIRAAGRNCRANLVPRRAAGRYRGRFLSLPGGGKGKTRVSCSKPFGGKLETLFPDPNYSAARYRGAILAPRGAAGRKITRFLSHAELRKGIVARFLSLPNGGKLETTNNPAPRG